MLSMGSSSEGKSRAQDFRLAYFKLRKGSGKPLTHVESDYFLDASGTRVGVTWSKKHDEGRWFLNLMEDKFDEAALLCQLGPNESVALRIPKDVVRRYWHCWSRDENGEMKFNVVRQKGRYYLQVPEPVGLVEADGFVERERIVAAAPFEYS
jgi:uncharacterized protein (DUF736 family)